MEKLLRKQKKIILAVTHSLSQIAHSTMEMKWNEKKSEEKKNTLCTVREQKRIGRGFESPNKHQLEALQHIPLYIGLSNKIRLLPIYGTINFTAIFL
jgi:spore germination cell wall hydrolase CwlJ-like protein